MDQLQNEAPKKPTVRSEVVERTITLLLAGLGLVAALAWNEAILSLFKDLFPQGGGLAYKFGYAILVTIIVVFLSMHIQKIKPKVEK
jgi:FtsH-binding integral membrane protein